MRSWSADNEGFWVLDAPALSLLDSVLRLNSNPVVPLPLRGVVNRVYGVGSDRILRLSPLDPDWHRDSRNEVAVASLVARAVLRTPALLAWAGPEHGLPVLATLYERVPGSDVIRLGLNPARLAAVYYQVGRDLARLHQVELTASERATLECPTPEDLDSTIASVVTADLVPPGTAQLLIDWGHHLATPVADLPASRLTHQDVHEGNLLIRPDGSYAALIDWGGAGLGDPARDFVSMDAMGLEPALAGYVAGGEIGDEDFRRRIMVGQLTLALADALIRPAPVELRFPLGRLMGLLAFWASAGSSWNGTRPPELLNHL